MNLCRRRILGISDGKLAILPAYHHFVCNAVLFRNIHCIGQSVGRRDFQLKRAFSVLAFNDKRGYSCTVRAKL